MAMDERHLTGARIGIIAYYMRMTLVFIVSDVD